jgi:hypothetical protein
MDRGGLLRPAGKTRDPKERDPGYQSLDDSTIMSDECHSIMKSTPVRGSADSLPGG